MTTNERILAILDHWDYDRAVDLLATLGHDPWLYTGRTSSYFNDKLREELTSLITPEKSAIIPTDDPLTEIRSKNVKALRRQDQLRWQHVLMVERKEPPEVILPVSREIVELGVEMRQYWAIINYFNQYGFLPPSPDTELEAIFSEAKNESDLLQIRNNYRSNVSRAKKGKLPAEKLSFYESVVREAELRITTR